MKRRRENEESTKYEDVVVRNELMEYEVDGWEQALPGADFERSFMTDDVLREYVRADHNDRA